MADSQSKIDAAAEKAFAAAAEKKAADVTKSAPVAVAPTAKVEAAPAPVAAPVAKPVAAAAVTPAAKQAAVSKTTRKVPAKKAVAREAVAKRAAKPVKKPAARKPVQRTAAPKISNTFKPTSTITQLKDKIMATTKTTDFTAKAKETVAEMQTRMKAAYDKGTEMTADVTAFHKGNFDAVVEAGKVLAAGMQDMGRAAVEDARLAAETMTADVKAMAAIKSPTELFQLQGEIARRNLDTLVARTSKNAEVVMKLANDMFAPLSTRASVAMERLTKAA